MTDLNGPQAHGYFATGLDVVRSKKLVKDKMFNAPKDLAEAYDRAKGFIAIEEAMGRFRLNMPFSEKSRDQDRNNHSKLDNNNRSDNHMKRNFNNGGSKGGRSPFPNRGVNKVYTPLNTDRAKILRTEIDL